MLQSFTHPIRILLIDDHPMIRSGLRYELSQQAGMSVAAVAPSVAESLWQVQHTPVDVVVSDLYLDAPLTGLYLLRQFRERDHHQPVLMMGSDDRPDTIRQVLNAGAVGFLGKQSTPAEFAAAIRWAVEAGQRTERYIAPATLRERINQSGPIASPPERGPAQSLTRKERAILRAFGTGLEPKEIAFDQKLAVSTVYSHLSKAREKLRIHHEVALRNFAARHLLP